MATETREAGTGVVPYRLTVRQFLAMIDAGVFPEGDRVELLGGVLVEKMTKNDPRDFAVSQLGDALRGILPAGWIVREEKSGVLGRFWRPEPDIAVAAGPRDRYRAQAPRPPDISLLVEVADSAYAKDRGVKWRGYASAGILCYWIVNIPRRSLEVYSDPAGHGRSAAYRDTGPMARWTRPPYGSRAARSAASP